MARRRLVSQPTRGWQLLRFDLSDDECGFLVENGGALCGNGSNVHAFRSREAALAYVKQQDPSADAPNGGFYDLRSVEAFVDGRERALPSSSLDVWSLLGEVAAAAKRDVPALQHATLPTVSGTGSSLVNPLRVALASGLDVFRDVVSYHEPAQLAPRARRATSRVLDDRS
jgi:hypothetical protein